MFKKQLIIEIEGVDENAVRKVFEIVKQEVLHTRECDYLVDLTWSDMAAEGLRFNDDLSIQTYTKTFTG